MTHGVTVEVDESRIDALFASIATSHSPGAAVGIAVDGLPVYRKGFGLASAELPLVLSPSMRLRIGSTTKHFTALSTLLSCEAGKARSGDPIRRYVPELHPVADAVTLLQLMTHTSGLRDVQDIVWQLSGTGRAVGVSELLALYRDIPDVNAAPGETWTYNNGGYLLLSVALERIHGASLEEILRKQIFEPAGMYDTVLRRWDTDFLPNSATLHMTGAKGQYCRSYLGTELTGEGGIASTVDDMLRWLAHMDRPRFGSPETWEMLKRPEVLENGVSTGYGCGLITSRYRGVEILWHPGGVMGGNAQMLKVPAARLDIVVLVNRHDILGMALANQILDACLPGLDPLPAQGSGWPLVCRVFRSPTTGRVIQLSRKHDEQLVAIDGDEMPFVRDPEGALRPSPVWGFVRQQLILTGDQQNPDGLLFEDFGNRDTLVAVEPSADADAAAVAGRYVSSSTGTHMEIGPLEDGARLESHGRFGSTAYRLEPLSKDIWRARSEGAMPWGGILVFAGARESFRWSTGRNRGLVFTREP